MSQPGNRAAAGALSDVRRGALSMAPLLVGVAPIGVAFAVSAQAVGFSPLETMLLSLLVFGGGSQMAVLSVTAAGGGRWPRS